MRKIALIMDEWKRCFTFAWPSGILQRIREVEEDVNLYIFSSSGNWSWDEEYNIGVSITKTEGPFGTDWAFF